MRVFIFFAAFFAAIVVPQLAAHGLNYLYPPPPRLVENEEALRSLASGFADPARVFGRTVRRELVQDARAVYPQVLQGAQVAQYGLTGTGASVIAARFDNAGDATQARYALFRMLGKVSTEEDDTGFFHFTWPQSQHAAIAGTVGRTFMMWVAPDRAGAVKLRAESRAFLEPPLRTRSGLAGWVDDVRSWPLSRQLVYLGAYVLLVSWLFLRLVSWATEVAPQRMAHPASAALLRERLLAVRFLESPITISPGRSHDQLHVDWKYADAKWMDHARAHGMRKTHRLVLQLDEARRTVRCREFHAEMAWDAGLDGTAIRWKAAWEIVFYRYEHERVFGLQVGPDGKLTPSLSYAYTFDIREMKAPLIAAATAAGWRWRQVFFFSPSWLRWLHG